jgi:hypothetical protein
LDTWTTVLRLATMWQMLDLRDEAMSQLTLLFTENDAGEMLRLSERYDVPQWDLPALCRLVNRGERLSIGDIQILGAERAVEVAWLREKKLLPRNGYHAQGCSCRGKDRAYYCQEVEKSLRIDDRDIAAAFKK